MTIEKERKQVLKLSPFLVFVAPLDHVKGGRRSGGDCGDYYSTTIASRRLVAATNASRSYRLDQL